MMTLLLWAVILLIAYDGVLASSDPRTAKTCGYDVAKCFNETKGSTQFKELRECFESQTKLPDCQSVSKELTSMINALASYEAAGKTANDLKEKMECIQRDETAMEYRKRFKAIVKVYDKDDEPVTKLIDDVVCCGVFEYAKLVENIKDNDCFEGAKDLILNLLNPYMQFADATHCSSAEKERCNTYFPST